MSQEPVRRSWGNLFQLRKAIVILLGVLSVLGVIWVATNVVIDEFRRIDSESPVINGYVNSIQDDIPSDMRDSEDWRHLKDLAEEASTSPELEMARYNFLYERLWDTVIPDYELLAWFLVQDESAWEEMRNTRSLTAIEAAYDQMINATLFYQSYEASLYYDDAAIRRDAAWEMVSALGVLDSAETAEPGSYFAAAMIAAVEGGMSKARRIVYQDENPILLLHTFEVLETLIDMSVETGAER